MATEDTSQLVQNETIDQLLSHVTLKEVKVQCGKLGEVHVYCQGDYDSAELFILTVHDMGCNHTNWIPLTMHPSMKAFTEKVYYMHVCIPGQEDNAEDLPSSFKFPTMQNIGQELGKVLDQLNVTRCIVMGEGAGANICARIALSFPEKIDGAILIHCTGTTAGFMEHMKDRLINWQLQVIGMSPTAESYLMLHRFGSLQNAKNAEEVEQAINDFQHHLRRAVNPRNLRQFIDTFLHRTNIADHMDELDVPVLFVTGDLAAHNHTVHTLHSAALRASKNRKRLELVEINDVANVIMESPRRLGEAILYFVQGIGRLPSLPMSHLPKGGLKYRSMSMEQADTPKTPQSPAYR